LVAGSNPARPTTNKVVNRKAATSNRYCFFVLCGAHSQQAARRGRSATWQLVSFAPALFSKLHREISISKSRHSFPTLTGELRLR
jgi:hypothetical protein